jgi:hypothetical protein
LGGQKSLMNLPPPDLQHEATNENTLVAAFVI